MMVRELFWLLLVIEMVAETQQQQQQQQFQSSSSTPRFLPLPLPSPSSADDTSKAGGTSEDQQRMMTTLPSEDEGLNLATGETAILECRVAASGAFDKNFSWTNAMTNMTITTHYTDFQNTSLIYQTLLDSNQTSLILTMSNLTVAKSEFRCELDIDENTRIQKKVEVNVFSSDRLCTFEGETSCGWEIGKAWTRKSSSPAASEAARCDAGFPDHTYGKDNVNGHYLVARVASDQQTEGGTLYTTLRNGTECIRFYYRTCRTNDSRGGAQLMFTMKAGMPLLVNLSLALDWTEHILVLPPQNQEQQQIIMSVTDSNASDFSYIAIDDIRTEDDNCDSADQQQVTKTDAIGDSGSLLQPPTSTITTNTALTTTSSTSSQSSASKTASTSTVSSSTTTTTTQPTSQSSTTTSTSTTSTTASLSSLPPTAMIQSTVIAPRLTSLPTATAKRTPDESEDSVRPTDDDRKSAAAATDEGGDEADEETGAAAAAAATGDNSTGLAIGIILAIMVAGACTAAILYRRRKNGKKSTYITFGNPSYSREHLPVNDFGLDSPLTLSSNGYTVLA